jgi:hypothetical protein
MTASNARCLLPTWMSGGKAATFGVALLCGLVAGCGSDDPGNHGVPESIVYVDLETRRALVGPQSHEAPAIHPVTGRRTLMPGLYCPECQRWHPAPPFDTLQRIAGAAMCRQHGTPLTLDGPRPEGDDS